MIRGAGYAVAFEYFQQDEWRTCVLLHLASNTHGARVQPAQAKLPWQNQPRDIVAPWAKNSHNRVPQVVVVIQ